MRPESMRNGRHAFLATSMVLALLVAMGLCPVLADDEVGNRAARPLVQNLALLGQWLPAGTNYHDGVYIQGNYAYLSDWERGFDIVDVSNPATPSFRANLPLAYKRGMDVVVDGNYAYVSTKYRGLHVIDIRNPSAPVEVGTGVVDYTLGYYALHLFKAGHLVYLACESGGVVIFDVTNPARPTHVGTIPVSFAESVWVHGNMAYVTRGTTGLAIYDVANPAAPQFRGQLPTVGYSYDVQVVWPYAYLAEGPAGLRVVNVTNPQAPVQVGLVATASEAYDIRIADGHAFIAERGTPGHVEVFRLSDPVAPEVVGRYQSSNRVSGVYAAGGRVYAAAHNRGLLVLDASFTQLPTSTPTLTRTPTQTPPPTATPDPRYSTDLTIQVTLQGRGSAPSAAWAVPLTVSLTAPNGGALLHTYSGTASTAGVLTWTGVQQGTYDVLVRTRSSLANRWRAVGLGANAALLDMQTLYEGDTNQDGRINILDFARLASSYGAAVGQAGYEASADLNGDGVINILDFALLASNYGLEGPRDVAP